MTEPVRDSTGAVTLFVLVIDSGGEVSRGEKMALRGTDQESYITEYNLVYEDKNAGVRVQGSGFRVQLLRFSTSDFCSAGPPVFMFACRKNRNSLFVGCGEIWRAAGGRAV